MAIARLLSIFALFLIATVPALAGGQRVMLVLDASGSMWAQIDGKSKMQIARETVAKVIPNFSADDEVGLVAYGHREKGSCDDIETVIEPAPFDADRFIAAVNALQPKGKTPMTQAVRHAAEVLKYTEKQATVILVSDGLETCDPNPCAVAGELERLGIGLTVHTVGFGLDDPKAEDQLKCLAEQTGGISILADDAGQLEQALKKTVQAANAPAPPAPEPEPVPEPEPAPEPEPVSYAIKGKATMGGVEVPAPFDNLSWLIFTAEGGKRKDFQKSASGTTVDLKFDGPGDYIVEINNNTFVAQYPVRIGNEGGSDLTVSLDAGIVNFSGKMSESEAVSSSATWSLKKASGAFFATFFGPTVSEMLPAGAYTLKLEDGTASVESPLVVTAGQIQDVVLTLGSGIIKPVGTYSGQGDSLPDDTVYELRLPPDISGEKKYIATEIGVGKQFKAPAGNYVIVASLGYAKAEVGVKVEAGQAVEAAINLNAGFLNVKSPNAYEIKVLGGNPGIDGNRPFIGSVPGAEFNAALNAGKYQVVVSVDAGEVVAKKDIEIVAGQRLELTLP